MKKGCELCKFHPDNVSAEDKENKNYCLGILGMDGCYTWNTPLFASDPDEWFQGENRIPEIKEDESVDCFKFERSIKKINAWWEESFDGLMSCDVLVVSPLDENGDVIDEHSLCCGHASEESLKKEIQELNLENVPLEIK